MALLPTDFLLMMRLDWVLGGNVAATRRLCVWYVCGIYDVSISETWRIDRVTASHKSTLLRTEPRT